MKLINGISIVFVALTGLILCELALAQNDESESDIVGYWRPLVHEDFVRRSAGPLAGDIAGLPLNERGKDAVANFNANEYYYKPENQCRNHGGGYVMRGPGPTHYAYEDENTLVIRIQLETQTRKIYFDGRAPSSAEPTNLGHSVGRWEGGMLTVTTTNMLPYFHRRNGVPYSENAVMTERFLVHDNGEYLTLITKVDDPEFLSEPIVRSVSFRKLPDIFAGRFRFEPRECEVVEWEGGFPGAPG